MPNGTGKEIHPDLNINQNNTIPPRKQMYVTRQIKVSVNSSRGIWADLFLYYSHSLDPERLCKSSTSLFTENAGSQALVKIQANAMSGRMVPKPLLFIPGSWEGLKSPLVVPKLRWYCFPSQVPAQFRNMAHF